MARFNPFSFFRRNRRLLLINLSVIIIFSLAIVPLSYSFARYVGAAPIGLFGLPNLVAADATAQPGDVGDLSADTIQESGQGATLPPAWDGSNRITILIMGLDYGDWRQAEGGPSRTDSMILLTIDPVTKTAGMLSIPRDLWAVIPGFTPNKINTAYYFGELYHLPGGGPELAMRTVEQTIGVPIDYYAQIDFDAFIRFIDLIGGVKINVPAPITVDPLGSDTQPKNLKAGVQVLPGIVALAYARERHAEGGDFARAERQQQVVLGIRDRILEFNLLPGLVAKAPEIYASLSAGIHTNLPLEDAIRLAVLATQIDKANIVHGVISEKDIIYGRSPDDLAILIPIPDKIRALRDQIFTSGSALGPLTPGSPAERMAAEAPRIAIQNGTGDTNLAARTQDYLTSLGASVVQVNNAGVNYGQTVLVDHTGNPYTLAFLAQLMGVTNARIIHDFDPNSSIDVEIRLGTDWQSNNSLP
jgi:LCP family protein required for cell wall assembly